MCVPVPDHDEEDSPKPIRCEALRCRADETRGFRVVPDTYPARQVQKIRSTLSKVIEYCKHHTDSRAKGPAASPSDAAADSCSLGCGRRRRSRPRALAALHAPDPRAALVEAAAASQQRGGGGASAGAAD